MSTTPEDPLVGTLLGDRYRVDRVVGQGGFGTVYEAFHLGLGERVAIKVLRLVDDRAATEADRVGAFLEEARVLTRLRHPHIVRAKDSGLYPSDLRPFPLPYLVMEWCSGPSLQRLLAERRGEPMSIREAWALLRPVVEAVAYAHSVGVVHRDLKPSNVLMDGDHGELRPRLIDFGIAKRVRPDELVGSGATQTAASSRAFTRQYAAPEQLMGARTGPWTDVYALGLLFVELLIGRPAVESHGPDAQLAALGAAPPTPGRFGVEVGPLEPVLARALALDPRQRYANASALRLAIDRAQPTTEPPSRRADSDDAPEAPSLDTADGAFALDDLLAGPTTPTSTPPRDLAQPRRRGLLRLATAATLAIAASATIGGVQRSRGAWPFSQTHLRELSNGELTRRMDGLGLASCTTQDGPASFVRSCSDAAVMRTRARAPSMTLDAFTAETNLLALTFARMHGAARFAVDGDEALIVSAKPDRVEEVYAQVLGEAAVEREADARMPPLPERRSAAADVALGSWSGADLVSSVAHTGELVTYANADTSPAMTMVQGADSRGAASVLLYVSGDPRAQLTKALATPGWENLAYALDEDRLLLVVSGGAFPSRAFLERILGEARAREIGPVP